MLHRTPRSHLFESMKAITVIATVSATLLMSYNLESYAACTQLDRLALTAEQERVKMLEGLKTDPELQAEFDQEVKNKDPENIKDLQTKDILKAVKKLRKDAKSIYEITTSTITGNIISGEIKELEKKNKANENLAVSTNEYTFSFDTVTKELKLILKPEVFVSAVAEEVPEVPIEDKKAAISRKNAKAKLPIADRGKADRTSVDKQFKKELEQSKKDLTCGGIRVKAIQTDYLWASAVLYARRYSLNYNSNFANYTPSSTNSFQGDCTNFASQIMYAGGIKMDGAAAFYNQDWAWYSYRQPWGVFDSISVSKTFRHVDSFRSHMYYYENTSFYSEFEYNYRLFDFLQSGDLMFIDYQRDGVFDHAMTITGWDSINGHWEPRLTYHTRNVDNIPFAQVLAGSPNAKFQGLQVYNSR
jgi:hypothetical protein